MDSLKTHFSFWKLGGISLAVTFAVWMLFAWPLPRFFAAGIPAAAHRASAEVRPMLPGDHLQFMYYCWLAGDMLVGQTPPGYNAYEFNTGNDRERFQPDSYYAPFSLCYALLAWFGGRAFGWNVTGFLTLWLTFLFTWTMARRWTPDYWLAGAAALLGIILPFRWINLFGGSPAGFAMLWIPVILLGVDVAVRDERAGGGVMAGMGVLFSAWTDQHVFFFGVLAVPFWGVLVLLARNDFEWRRARAYLRLLRALWPLFLFGLAALLHPILMRMLVVFVAGEAPVARPTGCRSMLDVLNYSPEWRGFFGNGRLHTSEHIYLGSLLTVFLIVGGLLLLAQNLRLVLGRGCAPEERVARPAAWRALVVVLLLWLGIGAIMLLALGARGPWHGALLRFCRAFIPPYALIRQPAKIFCLMPSVLAVAVALALAAFARIRAGRRWAPVIAVVFSGLLVWNYAIRVYPTISRLESGQGAYQAVADDAASRGKKGHLLVLPLWPGDSHYASVYQHFVSLYRLRMVNGYNPYIPENYFEHVFRKFESVNQGCLDEEQIRELARMGVGYIVLHENLFPEKVSPFPVFSTLAVLRGNAHLELLRQDGSVWAFRILASPRSMPETVRGNPRFPARRIEAEKMSAVQRVEFVLSETAGSRGYVALHEPGQVLRAPGWRVGAVPDLCWLVRLRGVGSLDCIVGLNGAPAPAHVLEVQSVDWEWFAVPAPHYAGFAGLELELVLRSGAVDVDLALLTAGKWPLLTPGQKLDLPAALFFHAGHMADSGAVVLRPAFDAPGIVFYGPKLPLAVGTYELAFDFDCAAPAGLELGVINLEQNEATGAGIAMPVVAGSAPAGGRWRQSSNLPFNLVFVYHAAAEMEVRRIVLTRLK